MPHKFRLALLIILCVIVIIGLLDSNCIRAAIANNAWSVSFIKQVVGNPNIDPQDFSPPAPHAHSGLLLAHQALKQDKVDLAAQYLAPLSNSSEPLVLDSIAKTAFLKENYTVAFDIWKNLGEWFTLEQAASALGEEDQLDEKILAYQSAYELFPQRYARNLVANKIIKADRLLKANRVEEAIASYQALLDQFPNDGRPYGRLAQAYWQNNQPELAIQAIEDGWLLNAGDVHFYNGAGRLYEAYGMRAQALFAYQLTLKIDSGNSEAQQGVQRLSGGDE